MRKTAAQGGEDGRSPKWEEQDPVAPERKTEGNDRDRRWSRGGLLGGVED